jgi:hypothetical protein
MEPPILIKLETDDVQNRLDELALIAAAYKKNRDEGLPVYILRHALIDACGEISWLEEQKINHIKSDMSQFVKPINGEGQYEK